MNQIDRDSEVGQTGTQFLETVHKSDVFAIDNTIATGYLHRFRRSKSGRMEEGVIIDACKDKVLVEFDYYEILKPVWILKSQCFKVKKRLLNYGEVGMEVYYVEENLLAEVVQGVITKKHEYHFSVKANDGRRSVRRTDSELYLLERLDDNMRAKS